MICADFQAGVTLQAGNPDALLPALIATLVHFGECLPRLLRIRSIKLQS